MKIIFLCKRQYTRKDVIDDRFGRLWHFPHGLSIAGAVVECFSLSYRRRGNATLDIDAGLRWHSFDTGILLLPAIRSICRALLDNVRQERPCAIIASSDVIHLTLGAWLSKRENIPLVVDLYDNYESFGLTRFPMMRRSYQAAVQAADYVVCVTRELSLKVDLFADPSTQLVVIGNATELTDFRPLDSVICRQSLGLPSDGFLFGTAGALDASRGIKLLYDAFECLHDSNIHLVLAGVETKESPIPDTDGVHFLGNLSYESMPAFYNALDLVIIQLTDNDFCRYCFPQKAYEILACKRPMLAASVGVMRELLSGYPDCLYEAGNVQMLVDRVGKQRHRPVCPDLPVPDWSDKVEQLFQLLCGIDECKENAAFAQFDESL